MVVEAKGVTLDIARATPCGLIINEFLTNTFKYAFPESFSCNDSRHEACTIRVTMKNDGELYELKVSDNGIGLPAGFTLQNQESLGMFIIRLLIEQLDGTISITSNGGVSACITVPDFKRINKGL